MSSAPASYRSSAVRPGPLGLIREAVLETSSRRMLIRYLVQADLKRSGADTLLGNLWWLLDPLLQLVVYVILVQVIFNVQTPDYPLFVFSAILPWKWFSSAVNDSILSVTSQDRLIKQIQFPKIVLPVAAVASGVVHFAFGLVPLLGLMVLFYADRLSPYLLLIPAIAVVQLAFTLPVALACAAVNVFFRDLGNLARHFLRVWFYLSPGLYSLAMVEAASETLATLSLLNPWTTLFTSYRAVIYGTADGGPTMPDWAALGIWLLISLVLLALATVFFKRLEPTFAKVV